MKNIFFLFLLFAAYQTQAQVKLVKLWETKNLPTPESVLPLGDLLYVSLIDGDGSAVDGKGGVAVLDESGKVVNLNWVTGLNAPKGMGAYQGKLYVADINEVVKIDIKSAKVEAKIPVEGSVFLNDIAIDGKGTVFVSDTRLGKVFSIVNDRVALYLDEVENANGLKVVKDDLYILSGPALVKVNKDKKREILAKGLAAGGDGLEPYGKDGFIATCWVGLIYHINANGIATLLLDSREEKINTADIGFNPKTNTLYVPTFLKNSVIAYKVIEE